MKKVLFFLFVAMALIGLSCKTTESGVIIDGEATEEKVNQALEDIYDYFFAKLDLSGAQSYTVKSGDTLSEITRTYYGSLTNVGKAGPKNGFYFPILMLASSNAGIVDPDKIVPGMRLTIPDLKKNLAEPEARKAIKNYLKDIAYVYNKKGKAYSETEKGLVDLANSL